MADRVIELENAHSYRASLLAKKFGITIEQARALKDTGSVIIPGKEPAKSKKEVSEDGD